MLPPVGCQVPPGVRLHLLFHLLTFSLSLSTWLCLLFPQGLPELGVPELPSFLKPPKAFRSATFDVTYLDQGMRVTRGDRCVGGGEGGGGGGRGGGGGAGAGGGGSGF